jgi:hypothetical protein
MIKNKTNNSSDAIAWENVRNRKSNKPFPPKETSPNTKNMELNENYVPKDLRIDLDDILYSDTSTYEKIRNINHKVNNFVRFKSTRNTDNIDWKKRLYIYIIHKSCKRNKHEIIASIIDNVKDYTIYSNAVSSTLSGNTCLFDAAYYGSDHCMNYLINRGADIHHKNKKGETIYDVLDVGLKAAIERFPNAIEIVENRFEDCIHLVKKAEARKLAGEVIEIAPKEDEQPKSIFKDDYDFDTLKEDLLNYVETPSVCREFIDFLKKNDFSMLLVRVLEEEDMEDVLIDNPYLAKLL